MSKWSSVILLLLLFTVGGWSSRKDELRIQFLVAQKSDANRVYHSDSVIPAAMMAVDDINDNPDYLPNYKLMVRFSDTQCDASEGTWRMIRSILDTSSPNVSNVLAFVGGSCAVVTEPTAALSGRLYKVIQISYEATSPILSDKKMYPLFYRTFPSLNLFNNLYFALMNQYNWCIVATLHQTVNTFSLGVTDFHERLSLLKNSSDTNSCKDKPQPILFSFTGDPEIPLRQIEAKDVRIILGYFYEDKAVVVMCYAKKMGLTNQRKYQWVFPGWYTDEWWNLADTTDWTGHKYNCTSNDIKEAVDYALLVDFYTFPINKTSRSLSGYTTAEFEERYESYLADYKASDLYKGEKDSPITRNYENLAYDAIWSLAIALNKTDAIVGQDGISLSDFEYSRASPDSDVAPPIDYIEVDDTINNYISYNLSEFMNSTNFSGVSGQVTFDENGDRPGYSILHQYRLVDGVLSKNQLALYNYDVSGLDISFDHPINWKGGSPLLDRNTPANITISTHLVIVMDLLVALGIIVAIAILIFNIVTIRKPLIRDSAPHINTVIIIGCIVLLCTCFMLGIDSGNPENNKSDDLDLLSVSDNLKERYSIICNVRLWFLTIGFTLSFGALFAKTWQVYRVYTAPKRREEPFKMWNFLIIMAVLLGLDLLFLSIWTGLYRFERRIDRKDQGATTKIFEYCYCENFSYLIGTLYVYKGLMAIFGLFLAYESRNVKYVFINDSRFVSISMYIVVILIGISAPLSLVLSEERLVDPAYGIAVFLITAACTSCLLILYIPKFYYMAKGKETMVPKQHEKFTGVDRLQLGRSEVNPEDIQNANKELKELKEQVEQKKFRLQERGGIRRGSDQDSGVHCTSDDLVEPNSASYSPNTTEVMSALNTTSTMETINISNCDGNATTTIHESIQEEEEEEIAAVDGDNDGEGNKSDAEVTEC